MTASDWCGRTLTTRSTSMIRCIWHWRRSAALPRCGVSHFSQGAEDSTVSQRTRSRQPLENVPLSKLECIQIGCGVIIAQRAQLFFRHHQHSCAMKQAKRQTRKHVIICSFLPAFGTTWVCLSLIMHVGFFVLVFSWLQDNHDFDDDADFEYDFLAELDKVCVFAPTCRNVFNSCTERGGAG